MQDLRKLTDLTDFLKNIRRIFEYERLYVMGDYIYYLPAGFCPERSIHYVRTGLLLGRKKNDRFEPSQALAMDLCAEEWKNPIILHPGDDRVLKYLKGETIDADDEACGYRLVCLDEHPLGWVKQSGYRCKNKYYPGWRYT